MRRLKGFTLLEMAVVLAIIGLVAAGAMVSFTAWMQSNAFNSTISQMDTIEQALLAYSTANHRIPCPSNLTCVAGQAQYGVEGNCTSTTAACTSVGGAGTTGVNFLDKQMDAEGGIPTRALGLPDSYMYDAWGNRLRYAVATRATLQGAVPELPALCDMGITVTDATGSQRTNTAIYAIISHGRNGHGAYTANGVTVNAGSLNANELTNCHCTSSGGPAGTYIGTYVEQAPSLNNTSGALYAFDDLVTFKENWQMATPASPALYKQKCVYLSDGQYSLLAIDTMDVFNAIGNSPPVTCNNTSSGDGGPVSQATFIAAGIALDGSGNLYMNDACGLAVRKINPQGIISSVVGNAEVGVSSWQDNVQATQTEVNPDSSVAVDSSGNIYIIDYFSNSIRRVTATTGIISEYAGYYHNYDYSGSGGTGDGGLATHATFNSPSYIALDASGNLYISDMLSDRIRMVTATDTIIHPFAGYYTGSPGDGSATGGLLATQAVLGWPKGLTVDPTTGNLYFMDSINQRILEVYATSQNIVDVVDSSKTSSGCVTMPTLASQAQYEGGNVMAADSSGNIYFDGQQIVYSMNQYSLLTDIAGDCTGPVYPTGTVFWGGLASQAPDAAYDSGITGIAIAPR